MKRAAMADLEAVVAIARRGSFRGAARALDVSPTALSHAIATLEARLGVRLFNRTTRSVSLTAAGHAFVAEITPALGVIRGAMEGVNRHRATPVGALRINSSSNAARQVLAPVVFEFLRRFPEMKVDLVAEDRLIDIVAEGFDAGVRLGDTLAADMIAVPLGPAQDIAVVGAPDYFATHKPPRTPEELLKHDCIRARLPNGALYQWEFVRRGGERFHVDVPGRLTLDNADLTLQAAREGLGLAYSWRWLAAEHLAAGRLIEVLSGRTPSYGRFRLYYPSRKYVPAGLRAFIDLAREMAPALAIKAP
ncbi:MAG TPA: LysR family transcriptional regulator [Steroidobacteraceae bacterium]|nr:LysR family transcriptional regulator [Steroidobacteraceae bacterium]